MLLETRDHILHLYLPRLPHLDPESLPAADSWIEEFYWTNCAIRLVELRQGGQTDRSLLESCSISKEDGSYRLQIKKGRRFHQGDEICAADVISCLLRVARRASSASQLGRLLRFQGLGSEKSFKLHSRYRFEILLHGLVPDLLERLALPECSIYRPSGISSGPWFVSSQSPSSLRLKLHPDEPRNSRIYEEVVVQTLEQLPLDQSHDSAAYLAIFPSTLSRAPQTSSLSGVMNLNLRPEMQLAVWLRNRFQGSETLRTALQGFAQRRNAWNLRRLGELYSEHSFAVDADIHPLPSDPHLQRKSWTFAYDPGVCSQVFLEDLAAFATHHFQLELHFQAEGDGVDGWIFALPNYSREASLSAAELGLRLLYRQAIGGVEQRPFLEKLLLDPSTIQRDRRLRDWLHALVHNPQFLPLGICNLLAFSNRMLLSDLPALGSLILNSVGESRPRQESKKLREATVSALGSAVQMLAHDIRRPFGTLEGVLSLLATTEDPEKLKELAKQYLPHVRRMTHTVNEMITDILEMGATGETLTEAMSPLTALEESLRLLLPSKKSIALTCELEHRLMLEADSYKLIRIFNNILNNAVQATPDGGRISISTKDRSEGGRTWIEIVIHNSGSFIGEEKRKRIFEAFYTEGGTGLGLAIVKKFVLAHGGQIACQSDSEKGTSFIVTLPSSYRKDIQPPELLDRLAAIWSTISPQAPTSAPLPSSYKRKLSLLWVDDDPLDLLYGKELVESLEEASFGVSLESHEHPEAALERARTERFDLIIIDYQLGSSNGLSWIPQFRKLQAHARIALHSHRSSSAIREAALKVGADVFFPKPLQKTALIDLCQSFLARRVQLILVEDDPLFTDIWQASAAESHLSLACFPEPKAMLQAWDENPDLLADCRALISDGLFEEGEEDGPGFLRKLRALCPELKLFLCTHLPEIGRGSAAEPWGRLSKEPEAIASFVKQIQSGHI